MTPKLSSSFFKGTLGEWLARLYLCFFGLRHVRSNHRSKSGEIDLIMQHSDTLVFIEVKSRSNSYIGDAIYSIQYKTTTHPSNC
ncbi:MAG: YraN family protein [Pseudomonadota bacterium]|nr:YraN family protein [Pseudomonadota bacterium]